MSKKSEMHLRLTVDVFYENVSADDGNILRDYLNEIVKEAYKNGLFTGSRGAELVGMSDKVEQIVP